MNKMSNFESRVENVKLSLTICGFIVIALSYLLLVKRKRKLILLVEYL